MSKPLTNLEIERLETEAHDLVKTKARYSAIAAALPIPFLDVGTDMKLINEITDEIEEIFNIDHDEVSKHTDDMKTKAAVMVTSMGGEYLARKSIGFTVNRISKKQRSSSGRFGVVPIMTQGASALISYFLMKKLGTDHIEKCVSYLKSKNIEGSVQEK